MRTQVQSLDSLSGLRIRHYLVLLWHRPVDAALILPLAWELPYITGEALKTKKKKKKKGSGIATSCGTGHRHGLDLALLWRRLAAIALI